MEKYNYVNYKCLLVSMLIAMTVVSCAREQVEQMPIEVTFVMEDSKEVAFFLVEGKQDMDEQIDMYVEQFATSEPVAVLVKELSEMVVVKVTLEFDGEESIIINFLGDDFHDLDNQIDDFIQMEFNYNDSVDYPSTIYIKEVFVPDLPIKILRDRDYFRLTNKYNVIRL